MNHRSSPHSLARAPVLSIALLVGVAASPPLVFAQAPSPAAASFPLSDCRYADGARATQRVGDRVLTLGDARWLLFDVPTRRLVTSGPVQAPSAAAFVEGTALAASGNYAVAATGAGGDGDRGLVLDLTAGRVVTEIGAAWGPEGLSYDGSYVWQLAPNQRREPNLGVTVQTPTGQLLARAPLPSGDDLGSLPFAAPGELRFLSGASPLETLHCHVLSLADGVLRELATPPGLESFYVRAWFQDGSHFILERWDGRTLIFAPDFSLVKEVLLAVPSETSGFGQYYYARLHGLLSVYRMDAPTAPDGKPTPILSVEGSIVGESRGLVAVQSEGKDASFSLIDLRGAAPAVTEIKLMAAPDPRSFASDDVGNWSLAVRGEVIASVPGKPTEFVKLGCRAP